MSRNDSFTHQYSTDELVALGRKHMSKNFRQAPLVFTRGEGLYVWDHRGKRYIDFVGGIAVNGMGHGHPRLVEAAVRQARQLWHVSNLYFNEPQILLSKMLAERFGNGRVFLCNSGAESVEAALKFARRYAAVVKGEPDRTNYISFKSSFHGRTMGSLTATGQPKYHKGFEPLIPGFTYADFNDLSSVEALIDSKTCGVIVEPLQAEGGLIMPEPGFLAGLKALCEANGALLIFDEVQVGCGRTGTFFAWERENVKPDVVTLAKALAGGLPIGAMITTDEVADGFAPGAHGSTFAGNAVASRVAQVMLEVLDEDDILENVQETGAFLGDQLNNLATKYDCVEGARGRGGCGPRPDTGDRGSRT